MRDWTTVRIRCEMDAGHVDSDCFGELPVLVSRHQGGLFDSSKSFHTVTACRRVPSHSRRIGRFKKGVFAWPGFLFGQSWAQGLDGGAFNCSKKEVLNLWWLLLNLQSLKLEDAAFKDSLHHSVTRLLRVQLRALVRIENRSLFAVPSALSRSIWKLIPCHVCRPSSA